MFSVPALEGVSDFATYGIAKQAAEKVSSAPQPHKPALKISPLSQR
jgi:hypothetical protein